MTNISELLGGRIINTRLLTEQQISQLLSLGGRKIPATFQKDDQLFCARCLSKIDLSIFKDMTPYCRACLNFGKIMHDDELLISPVQINFSPQQRPMAWDGQLTSLQRQVSEELLVSYEHSRDHLVWAVTGAGKTEIIFPLLDRAIKDNKRIAICSPRIDVCIELFPRIQKAFPNTGIGLFHGRSDQPYFLSQIFLGTVHQLVRFQEAFDVLVVDEVDSFPLVGDIMLERAIHKAKNKSGMIVYLSATPPLSLLKKVEKKEIYQSKLYQRFHGHPLPEPKMHLLFKTSDFMGINPRLKWQIKRLRDQKQRFMIFFPRISNMLKFEKELQRFFPNLSCVSVSSKDPQRLQKVQMFREQKVDVILTTTILERGVTFHKIAVLVIDADSNEYSKTALIQIAGRAGRSKDSFDDEVHFYYQYFTEKISLASQEIKSVNKQAYQK